MVRFPRTSLGGINFQADSIDPALLHRQIFVSSNIPRTPSGEQQPSLSLFSRSFGRRQANPAPDAENSVDTVDPAATLTIRIAVRRVEQRSAAERRRSVEYTDRRPASGVVLTVILPTWANSSFELPASGLAEQHVNLIFFLRCAAINLMLSLEPHFDDSIFRRPASGVFYEYRIFFATRPEVQVRTHFWEFDFSCSREREVWLQRCKILSLVAQTRVFKRQSPGNFSSAARHTHILQIVNLRFQNFEILLLYQYPPFSSFKIFKFMSKTSKSQDLQISTTSNFAQVTSVDLACS
ncbi:hypothetical protein R3P38DRAFT_3368516 [Favolaschia claudopus]|uniref:Uncharacterized protein n=1 Tax=Favolaschia claudopus TaxID=2862362 RepID=A0AAW0A473_9AGAR